VTEEDEERVYQSLRQGCQRRHQNQRQGREEELAEVGSRQHQHLKLGGQRRSQRAGRGKKSAEADQSDTDTVACLCGVHVDDGKEMIECEGCKCWAHTLCLANAVSCCACG